MSERSLIATRDNPEAGVVTPFGNEFLSTVNALPEHVPEIAHMFEIAGRKFMTIRGQEAEQDVCVPQNHPTMEGVMVKTPLWALAAAEIADFNMKLGALQHQMKVQIAEKAAQSGN